MKKIIANTKECRLCESKKLYAFLNLGNIPIKNAEKEKNSKIKIPNLKILVCKNCWHVQAGKVPLPDFYIRDYTYHTRFSKTVDDHFNKRASEIIRKFNLKNNDLVIDIGGNDGTFLGHFKRPKKKIRTLCVDPTFKTTFYAKKRGIEVFRSFFNLKTSAEIKRKFGIPKIILCTNTFGAINDMNEFVSGIAKIIDEKSVFIYENPYLIDTFKGLQFDTMYYEHISYFAVSPMAKFFEKFGLEIFDYSKSKIHGGSMMVFVRKKNNKKISKKIKSILNFEIKRKFNTTKPYKKFSDDVEKMRKNLNLIIKKVKKNNKTIAAYGASDRGLTLLNYCKLNFKKIEYMVDVNTFKQNLYFSGTKLKIYDPKKLIKEEPDYILLSAWNFKDEIIKSLKKLKIKSKYILPLPKPTIIE